MFTSKTGFTNGKDFAQWADLTTASTNSVKTEKALKRIVTAMSPVGEERKYYSPKITVPGYRYHKESYYDQEIVIDVDDCSIVMASNRKFTRPQDVLVNKTKEGAITQASFMVAIEHFRGVNNLMNGHYKYVDAATKTAYPSAIAFFKEVIRPKNLKAIAQYKAALKALGKVKA